jgi:hypothetical protein
VSSAYTERIEDMSLIGIAGYGTSEPPRRLDTGTALRGAARQIALPSVSISRRYPFSIIRD